MDRRTCSLDTFFFFFKLKLLRYIFIEFSVSLCEVNNCYFLKIEEGFNLEVGVAACLEMRKVLNFPEPMKTVKHTFLR
jgi:hypothetical protein